MLPPVLRGIVKSAYVVPGQGAYVSVELLSGPASPGVAVDLPLRSGTSRRVEVAGVELLRHEAGRAEVALRIAGLDPSEVLIGAIVRQLDE
jgi:hypothetical protein